MKLLPSVLLVTAAFVTGCSWGEDSGSSQPPGPDAPVTSQPVCGDTVCASSELNTCPADCGQPPACNGDGQCQANETAASCPTDCGQQAACNNDGTCQPTETAASCAADCGGGSNMGNCPADPSECIECASGGACPTGLDSQTCLACVTGGGGGSGGGSGDPTTCILLCSTVGFDDPACLACFGF